MLFLFVLAERQNTSILQRFQRRQQHHNRYWKMLNLSIAKRGLVSTNKSISIIVWSLQNNVIRSFRNSWFFTLYTLQNSITNQQVVHFFSSNYIPTNKWKRDIENKKQYHSRKIYYKFRFFKIVSKCSFINSSSLHISVTNKK